MLLPDNIHPQNTVYYNGAIVLSVLQKHGPMKIFDLYRATKDERQISFSLLVLCLDWLYLIDAASLNGKGEIELCS